MAQNIKMITTKFPTYLKKLLEEDSSIKLIFQERKSAEVQQINKNQDLQVTEELSELELTGTPLHIDLGGGDDTVLGDIILERPPSWTAEEAQQYPVTLSEARTFINRQLMLKNSSESLYAICDGRDKQRTVILGATIIPHRIGRILVYILPCYDENHEITTIEYMKKDHFKSVRKDAKIEVSSTKKYNLFGYDLENSSSLENVEYNGNISVDVSVAENKIVCRNNVYSKLNLQVVVGHRDSPLNGFWSELCLIQKYIKQLESVQQINDSTVINLENNLCFEEIISQINDIVSTVTSFKNLCSEELDLKNLRQLNILDHLWSALKHCRTLSDLRNCFHTFFEELAEDQTKMHFVREDKFSVGEIVNGILDGKIAIPTLSLLQALELLVELGLEKLKKDYLAVITSFSAISNEAVLKKWSEVSVENATISSGTSSRRKTRLTINPKTPITDLTSNKLKLSFLDSLHKTAEFMFLSKGNLQLSEEGFDSFCETLCDKFIEKFPKVVVNCDFKQPRLWQFSFNISQADANVLIKDKVPVASTVKLVSSIDYSDVITVFHFSEYPIFPPCVFEDYEIQSEDSVIKNLYVTKLVKYVQHC